MKRLDHEKLHVYEVALAFLTCADGLITSIPRGHAYLTDQLHRAASSVCLNIAEGAGEFSRADKARFHRMARRSATECAAILDVCARLRICHVEERAGARALLVEVVAMLTAMSRAHTGTPRAIE